MGQLPEAVLPEVQLPPVPSALARLVVVRWVEAVLEPLCLAAALGERLVAE